MVSCGFILTTQQYSSESWVTYHHHLEHIHQCCLHTILNIYWSNYISNIEVLDQAEITSIEVMLLKSQLQWAGHVFRMGGGITCPRKPCIVNSPLATLTKGHQRNILNIPSKRPSVPATLTTTSGRHLQLTVRPGSTPSIRSSPPLRTPAEPTSGRNTAGGRSWEPQQPY